MSGTSFGWVELANLTIRNIDGEVMRLLEQRAAARGVSVEEEALLALSDWLKEGIGTSLQRRFESYGDFELEILPRGSPRPLEALEDPRRYTWDEVDAAISADLDSLESEKPNSP